MWSATYFNLNINNDYANYGRYSFTGVKYSLVSWDFGIPD